MAYELEPSASLADELRRVVSERLTEAITLLEQLADGEADDVDTAVHEVRKRCKAARAAARLARSSIGDEFERFNRQVREAANTLAPIRDAGAVLATFDDLVAAHDRHDDPDLARVRIGHLDAADEARRAVRDGGPRVERAHRRLVAARLGVERWPLGEDFGVLSGGITDTYRRGRKALRQAEEAPTDEHFHEWRKAVKNLWYQTRLIERAAPSVMEPLVASLDALADALGDDHDLAVLIERLTDDPDRFGGRRHVEPTAELARLQQQDLRRRAFRLGASVYAETPKAFTRRMRAYWELTARDGPELPTGGISDLASC